MSTHEPTWVDMHALGVPPSMRDRTTSRAARAAAVVIEAERAAPGKHDQTPRYLHEQR